jgi:integrase/recombinase XerD
MLDGLEKLDPRKDPLRRCMKFNQWPRKDRAAWKSALAPSGLLEETGLAAGWRDLTQRTVLAAYGRWLTFLDGKGWLDPNQSPGERLTPDRLRAYVTELETMVAHFTVRNRIRDLNEALRVMAPDKNFAFLRRAYARLKARAHPKKSKRPQMRTSEELFALGLNLIARAEQGEVARPLWRAALFRDGLMIVMLACRPLRRANLAFLRIGQHLVRQDDEYIVRLEGSVMKNHRDFEQPLPAALSPLLDRYIHHYRPQLLGRVLDDHLWISWRGEPLAETGVYEVVTKRTQAAFGIAIPPHRFRDCTVTSLVELDPKLLALAPSLLHHSDVRTAEKHYDHARDNHAVTQWQRNVQAMRKAAKAS